MNPSPLARASLDSGSTRTPAFNHRQFFLKALHPQARLLRVVLLAFDPRYFDADHDLVASLANVKTHRELSMELTRFRYHPLNHGWLRRKLRLRISTHRCRTLAEISLKPAQ